MARIHLERLAHAYRTPVREEVDYALKPLDFTWEDGGTYALLGPSGCGKSTLLNIISGLLRPSEGKVLYDGRDVTALSPTERNIAQVFQFPVVYDTMSVFENLAFPLRNRRLPRARVRERVEEVAAMLELQPLLKRRAAGLGADEKQKISLGRGLVREDVAAILFDEPLTVIDPALKWQLRRKLKEVHERFRRTLVYVTHDQNEALTFAQKVVVMLDGRVLQLGTPQELFEEPAHRFVGYFIGSPGMNFLPLERQGEGLAIEGSNLVVFPHTASGEHERGRLELGIRPEFVEVLEGAETRTIEARIERVTDLGNFKLATFKLGGHTLTAKIAEGRPLGEGKAWIRFPERRSKLYHDEALVSPRELVS